MSVCVLELDPWCSQLVALEPVMLAARVARDKAKVTLVLCEQMLTGRLIRSMRCALHSGLSATCIIDLYVGRSASV